MPINVVAVCLQLSGRHYIFANFLKNINRMRLIENLILCLVSAILFCSCAARYRTINPSAINYPEIESNSNFTYKYNVLKEAGNKKLAKKENKYGVRIVAIKFTNTTGQTLTYGHNYKIFSGTNEAFLFDPRTANKAIRQTVPTYLLYLLLTPMRLNVGDDSKSYPIGLVIGPAITAGNVAVASTANKRFREELINNDVKGREIKSGETFYGLIAIRDNAFMPLNLKLIK